MFLRLPILALASLSLLAACRPTLDDDAPRLTIPKSLPQFTIQRPAPGVAQRARDLAAEGTAAMDRGELLVAVPILTQAVATDPSSPEARLHLARAFARGGRASVALQLLGPAKAHLRDCGACVELLQAVIKHPDFKHLRETSEGRDLLREVPEAPLPYARWARRVAQALQKTDLAALVSVIDAQAPFDLVRSCPTCQNVGARAETRRPLIGMALAAKVAVRFDVTHADAHGLPLLVPGEPSCKDRCCTWQLPQPIPMAHAGLRRLCFWPQTPAQGVLTQAAFEYGPSAPLPAVAP